VNIGDVFSIDTSKGKAILQFCHINKEIEELIRLIPGLYKFLPAIEQIILKEELFLVCYPLKTAYNKGLITFLGNYNLPKGFKIPKYFRTPVTDDNGNILGWHIVNYKTWKRKKVKKLSKDQKKLSPWVFVIMNF
jgi:hypothetical protein